MGRWPFPADVATSHLSPSRCCRSTPLSRSPSPSRLLQRHSELCAARTDEHLKCSSSGSSHEVLSKIAPLSTPVTASRCQIRRPGEEAANLFRGAVHAVSHDFDGFVRRRPCGLVASHYRLWGSPGFALTNDDTAAPQHSSQAPTLRSFPLLTKWTPSPNHCWPVHRMPGPSRG